MFRDRVTHILALSRKQYAGGVLRHLSVQDRAIPTIHILVLSIKRYAGVLRATCRYRIGQSQLYTSWYYIVQKTVRRGCYPAVKV